LLGCRFSHRKKGIAGRPASIRIETSEFELVWSTALRSSLWERQAGQSLAAEWGAAPFWLRCQV
jgi:hypothetical protein